MNMDTLQDEKLALSVAISSLGPIVYTNGARPLD
jgi:hypothetical protein